MAEERFVRISELPVAANLDGVEVLLGNQDGVTKQFPVELFANGNGGRQPPYFQPLAGTTATIPLPAGVLAATVLVLDSNGAEVSLAVRHLTGQVVIESRFDMAGLTARLTF